MQTAGRDPETLGTVEGLGNYMEMVGLEQFSKTEFDIGYNYEDDDDEE